MKGEAELLDHGAITVHGIDTDADDLRASISELRILHGIAHELPIAVGSPVATVEDQNRRTGAERSAEAPRVSLLIWQFEIWVLGVTLLLVHRFTSLWTPAAHTAFSYRLMGDDTCAGAGLQPYKCRVRVIRSVVRACCRSVDVCQVIQLTDLLPWRW